MIEFLNKGGPVMYILLALSIYSIAAIMYKSWQFIQCRITDNSFGDSVMAAVRAGENKNALEYLDSLKSPQAAVMAGCIRAAENPALTRETRDMEIMRVASTTFAKLETHMKGLELVASAAPLLGLLGTVIGMVVAFSVIEEAGSRVTPSLLAGGIWQELINTVGGLIVAIPALFAFHIFDAILQKSRLSAQDLCIRALTVIEERKAKQPVEEATAAKSRLFRSNAV